ncbi:MAG: hypothetical protein M5U19_14695 [Microthrixaceae bacterium]|nr:hypothetical protein [Microthrixaceae bacterium]
MKDRLFRGYGPLIGFTALFLAVVLLVPSKVPDSGVPDAGEATGVTDLLGEAGDDEYAVDGEGSPIDPETGEPIGAADDPLGAGDDPSGSGEAGGPGGAAGPAGVGPGGGQSAGPGGAQGANKGPAKVAGCGAAQVPGDPYSPPCIQFSGNNGGATSRGVSADKIVVTVRIDGFDSGLVDAVTKSLGAAGKIPTETREKVGPNAPRVGGVLQQALPVLQPQHRVGDLRRQG